MGLGVVLGLGFELGFGLGMELGLGFGLVAAVPAHGGGVRGGVKVRARQA